MKCCLIFWELIYICHFFKIPECSCNPNGAVQTDGVANCNSDGQCVCMDGYMGEKCEKCVIGHYNMNNDDEMPLCSGINAIFLKFFSLSKYWLIFNIFNIKYVAAILEVL